MAKDLTNNELALRTQKLVKRVQKRIAADKLDVTIYAGEAKENCAIVGEFVGNSHQIGNSRIFLHLSEFNFLVGDNKLRRWNASIITAFIHEYSHYLLFKKMSIVERDESIRKYTAYKYFRDKDEIETWKLTAQLLKKYGYLRSKTMKLEFKKFQLPKGYKILRKAFV